MAQEVQGTMFEDTELCFASDNGANVELPLQGTTGAQSNHSSGAIQG